MSVDRIESRAIATLLWLVAACAAVPVSAQDAGRPVTIDDLVGLRSVDDPQVSPDGKWVAYTVTERDFDEDERRTRIWMVSVDGGEPIPMTAPDYSASSPRWSPDNRYLSFKAAKGEDAESQVWNLNRLGGEAQQVTDVKQGIEDFAWSPDASRLLLTIKDPTPAQLTEDEEDDDAPRPHVIDRIQFKQDYVGYLDRRRTHVYVYTPGTDAPVQLTSGDYDDSDPAWSPDGTRIAFVSDRSENPDLNYGEDIWVVAADGSDAAPVQVTANPGRDLEPAWSPDGRRIAYVTSTGADIGGSALTPTRYLAITEVGRDQRRILTADIDNIVSNPSFSGDGREILFELADRGRSHLAAVRPDGTGFRRVVDGELTVRDYAASTGRLVALLARATQPENVYLVGPRGLTALTDVNADVLDGVARADVEKRRFESADGTEVEAFFVKPVGYRAGRRYATILWLHGGPASQFTYDYVEAAQLFAANGYAVIMPNPRGSIGYGEAFARATVAEWGKKDVDDVLTAVDHGVEIGLVDPDRLGVGGWSYGGILTNYVITQTDRFAAAVSGASLGLVTANYGHDHYQLMYELEFGLPWKEPERWAALSPFTNVENITTPTLWMGGALDWNVPIINSEQMYLAMKRLGRETELVVYPDEHHGIRRPSFVRDRYERWLAWFGRYIPDSDTSDGAGAGPG